MNKSLILLIPLTILCGCKNGAAGGKSGKVDCSQITVSQNGTTLFSRSYSTSYSYVYEYKDEYGRKMYGSARINYSGSSSGIQYAPLRVYKDRYKEEYTVYNYSRFVGFLFAEYNYYLNLGSRTIDSEIKWSEYKFSENAPTSPDGQSPNNKEAYTGAKKGYYQIGGYDYYFAEYYEIKLDITDSSLERHTYTMLGDDCVISYTPKA